MEYAIECSLGSLFLYSGTVAALFFTASMFAVTLSQMGDLADYLPSLYYLPLLAVLSGAMKFFRNAFNLNVFGAPYERKPLLVSLGAAVLSDLCWINSLLLVLSDWTWLQFLIATLSTIINWFAFVILVNRGAVGPSRQQLVGLAQAVLLSLVYQLITYVSVNATEEC